MTGGVRERRIVALGLLAAVLALIWFALIGPVVQGFAERAAERDTLQTQLLRDRRLTQARGFWEAQARAQRADAPAYTHIAPDASAAVQQAGEQITAALQSTGADIRALREQSGAPGYGHLHLEAQVTLTQLVACLKLLEGTKPYLIIEQFSVAADPAAGRTSPLEARIDLAVPYSVRAK